MPSFLRAWPRCLAAMILAAALCVAAFAAQAKLTRLDVFLGYDTIVPEGNWFPVAIEVQNNGPAFEAVFEVMPSQFARGQIRRMVVELPTGTVKRFVIPVFNASRGNVTWDVIVRDSRGNKRDEVREIRPRRNTPMQAPLVGALVRTVGGMPEFPTVDKTYSYLQPVVARLQPAIFPDNPVALGGLAGLYLNAEKAQDLKENQVKALLAWLSEGGHLVVALHQASDLQASPWLRDLLPLDISGQQNLPCAAVLNRWIGESTPRLWTLTASKDTSLPGYRNLTPDDRFLGNPSPVVTGRARGGRTVLADGGVPLIISAPQGRGTVTVLTFSPETEPFRSWQSRKYFWAKLFEIPTEWITQARKTGYNDYSGWSMDSIFGAITDSRQVRKLPVGWLLLLLITYLAVIGPVDQYVLKKINRQMLTWLTFPAYVLLFSGLIYFIGYKLRAGDIEWNEFHLVDTLNRGDGGAALRGHAFASIYSPANARYQLESTALYASFRDEYAGSYGGAGMDANRSYIEQRGNNFVAEVAVPVWTSQMYVGDWWQGVKETPLSAVVNHQGTDWEIEVKNHLDRKLSRITIVAGGRLHEFTDSQSFSADNLVELASLVRRLKQPNRLVDTWLAGRLSPATKTALASYERSNSDLVALKTALVQDINSIIRGPSIYEAKRFSGVVLHPDTQRLLSQNPQGNNFLRLNRLLFEDAYPLELSRMHFADVPARGRRAFNLNENMGTPIGTLVSNHADRFWQAANSRRSALGGNENVRPAGDDILRWAVAGSFLNSHMVDQQNNHRRFQAPIGFDLSASALRGDVIVFAWVEEQLLVKPINENKFSTTRSQFEILIRLVVPEVKNN